MHTTRAYHAVAAAFVAICIWLAVQHHEIYRAAMQEDRAIEWVSAFVYGVAGVLALRRAWRERRAFDGLVGLFLLFVAGEEVSWGQRLLGLTPPSWFLAHNEQQEMNLHNFATFAGSPKGPFSMILIGYAVVMPLVASSVRGQWLLARLGATPPPIAIIPWFLAAIVLLFWYPLTFTGEWVELLAGSAFLMCMGASDRLLAALLPTSVAFGAGMAMLSSRGERDPALIACAAAEANALVRASRAAEWSASNTHKRVWTLVGDGVLDAVELRRALGAVSCRGADASDRRRYAVDPWGTAYWLRARRDRRDVTIVVYSFGPNRRRDEHASGVHAGDDVLSSAARVNVAQHRTP